MRILHVDEQELDTPSPWFLLGILTGFATGILENGLPLRLLGVYVDPILDLIVILYRQGTDGDQPIRVFVHKGYMQ